VLRLEVATFVFVPGVRSSAFQQPRRSIKTHRSAVVSLRWLCVQGVLPEASDPVVHLVAVLLALLVHLPHVLLVLLVVLSTHDGVLAAGVVGTGTVVVRIPSYRRRQFAHVLHRQFLLAFLRHGLRVRLWLCRVLRRAGRRRAG